MGDPRIGLRIYWLSGGDKGFGWKLIMGEWPSYGGL
jgi:hypothetical protein